MKETKTLDRREFTLAAAMAALSGVAITISACGGGGSPTSSSTPTPPPSGGGGAATDKTGVIGTNHGHSGAVITAAQLTAGGALSLNIEGTAGHPHTVELAAADIAAIASNQRVARESTSDGAPPHSHTVTFN